LKLAEIYGALKGKNLGAILLSGAVGIAVFSQADAFCVK
jgi:hypothetical protein